MEFGSTTVFRLPDGSVFSPDASLRHMDRWHALSPEGEVAQWLRNSFFLNDTTNLTTSFKKTKASEGSTIPS